MTVQTNSYANPALIIVDMQNDFVRREGPLRVPDALGTVPAHLDLIAAFRTASRPVIYTKFLSRQTPNLAWNWSPECAPPLKCCWQGHRRYYGEVDEELECTEVIGELAPSPDDLIIQKYGYGAFHGTGAEVFASGKKYEGEYIEGKFHGKGLLKNPNGSSIEATFRHGEPYGQVRLTTAAGEIFTARTTEPGVCYRDKSYRATECPKLEGW